LIQENYSPATDFWKLIGLKIHYTCKIFLFPKVGWV